MIEPITLFLIAVATLVAGYLLVPRPRLPEPAEAQELEVPTSEAGKPISKVFGDVRVRSPNVLGAFDKQTRRRMVKA